MKVKILQLAGVLIATILFTTNSTAQTITTPRVASPASEVTQTVGISKITINYSRPSVKEREIWGKLVPYGYNNLGFGTATAAPWRAGANENTTITFSNDVTIEGKAIKAGTYGLHIAVMENGDATVILSNNSSSWGSFFYNEEEDALRADVKTTEIPLTETLTYDFIGTGKEATNVVLDWGKKRIPFNVKFATDEIVMANANNELRGVAGFGWQGPLSAARYCLQNDVNLEQGIKWADKSMKANKNFQNVFVKASLLKKTGSSEDLTPMFDEAAEMASMGQLNFLGYQMMTQHKNMDKAIEYFKLNVKRNSTNANVHDSLGEAYKTDGQNKLAIKTLKKSLTLNPPPATKQNSLKLLKEMGVDVSDIASVD